jgi:hypothetical protein
MRNGYKMLFERLKRRGSPRDLGIGLDGRIILKWIEKTEVNMTGFIWLSIGTSGWLL